jgi:hypothetical protein
MKPREFLTLKELSSRILARTIYQEITYCVEETGYEYEIVDGRVQIVGSWWV